MAQNILSTIISPKGLKIVDEASGFQVLSNLKVKSVTIESPSDTADIPFAVGGLGTQSVVDESQNADLKSGKVLSPTRIVVNAMSGDSTLNSSLIALFLDQSHTLRVTSKSIISKSMVISSVNIIQDKDSTSADRIEIAMEQVQQNTDANKEPKQAADSNAAGVFVQEPSDLTTTVSDLYNKIKSNIGGLL